MSNEEITKIIEEFLERLTIDYEKIEFVKTNFCNTFVIHTKDAGILIGNRGETLEALSFLLRRVIENKKNTDDEHPFFIIDINNYQIKKFQTLISGAHVASDRAKLFRQDVELSPMTSYERMIVHSTFSEDPEINTESDGQGRFRHVVIKYVGDKKVPITE